MAHGNTAISTRELEEAFDHCCFRWGRFGVQRMRDDAREAEKTLRDRGYPAARVIPEASSRPTPIRSGRIHLPVQVIEKRKVDVKFVGNDRSAIASSAIS